MDFKVRKYDFIVVGSGVAGLSFALGMQERKGLIIARSSLTNTNTNLAQGGIAAAIGDDDSPRIHLEDTLRAGAGLSEPAPAEILVNEGPNVIRRLIGMGASFDRMPDGKFHLSCEGAHSRRRILHSRGYATGREIQETLLSAVRETDLELREGLFCLDLVVDNGRIIGIWAMDEENQELSCLIAPVVMLATGGCGGLYPNSTNSSISGGDGFSAAYLAGAVIRDPEMIQFHPTAMFLPGHDEDEPLPLITEALRGEGATLHNAAGEQFMIRYHPDGELAPRDVTTLAIYSEMKRESFPCVFLDVSKIEDFGNRFPHINEECEKNKIVPGRDRIPVAPAVHYSIGGIKTDLSGRTNLPGLYAAGEAGSTGIHGANRLASNSLLEGLVFGERAARAALKDFPSAPHLSPPEDYSSFPSKGTPSRKTLVDIRTRLRSLMWERVGIVRDGKGLREAAVEIEDLKTRMENKEKQSDSALIPLYYSVRNALVLGGLITQGAGLRLESRGAHHRSDFPESLPAGRHTELLKDQPEPLPIGEEK